MYLSQLTPEGIQKSLASGNWKPNIYLTNVSVAQFQKPDDFVARKVFPIVPVSLPTARYYQFSLADLARISMAEKPQFGTVNPSVWGQTDDSYSVKVYQGMYGIDQISASAYNRAGAPGVADPKVAKAKLAAEQVNLFMDYMFAKNFFTSGVWTTEYTGQSSTPSANQFWQFDNDNSNPIQLFDDLKSEMKEKGRRTPNKLALGVNTYKALKNNKYVLERIKYGGSSANPATVNEKILAELFGIDQVLVLESTYNEAGLGQSPQMQYICDKNSALLCYTTDSPAIDEPSAGYIFAWDMLGNGQHMAITDYLGAPGTHSEFVEALCSFDMKRVSQDLAVFLTDCVSE